MLEQNDLNINTLHSTVPPPHFHLSRLELEHERQKPDLVAGVHFFLHCERGNNLNNLKVLLYFKDNWGLVVSLYSPGAACSGIYELFVWRLIDLKTLASFEVGKLSS